MNKIEIEITISGYVAFVLLLAAGAIGVAIISAANTIAAALTG